MKPHKKDLIPRNVSREELAQFWATHSFADYWEELKPVTMAYRPREERKEQAKARVLEIAQEMSSTFAKSGLSEDEVRTLIEQEVEEVRSQK